MKPRNLPRQSPSYSSFSVGFHSLPYFLNIWHFHREIELCLIKKSSGTLFVGDFVGEFCSGEILMFGSNLPHMTLNDKKYFNRCQKNSAQAIAVHFDPEFLGHKFFELPEMSKIYILFNDAKLGIKFHGNGNKVKLKMEKLASLMGFEKVMCFLDILNILASIQDKELLASPGFMQHHSENTNSKLNAAQEYIFNNFLEEISLHSVAGHVRMNTSAFSRFFKKATNKSFVKYIIELRIGHACKLLLEDEYKNISEVCYESGFNNLSSFNKAFKKITGRTPREYVVFHKQPNIIAEEG